MNVILLTIVLLLAIASLSLKKSIASLISFALMMLVLGLYYISLDEKLLGLFQIFVYAGGISVLMLFGITLIGVEFPKSKVTPWSAALVVMIFVALMSLFFLNHSTLDIQSVANVEKRELFASSFSDLVLIFALIASSLLYGTIKMMRTVKKRGERDV
jgi:NADH-quinone oxidoreductase subunit J